MIKRYKFDYDTMEAEAAFTVDTEKFTNELAMETLTFFTWDYDKEADPVDEVMKKYAMQAITIATKHNYNELGVISEFNLLEGFAPVDGSFGIQLTEVSGVEFDESKLEMEVLGT